MLGKRKRRSLEENVPQNLCVSSSESGEDAQAVFRRYFEAQFKPLEVGTLTNDQNDEITSSYSGESGSEWDGFSEQDDEHVVEVVKHRTQKALAFDVPREEIKLFMTSKPPSSSISRASKVPKSTSPGEDSQDVTDAAMLKNDLALQRLLQESHLLDPNFSYAPTRANRHKATDLRIQSLGSKSSILTQERMPLSHRKGIVAKAADREERRRKEAKENSIILEKIKNAKKTSLGKRERSVDGPGVGTFRKGLLKLSKRDVADIEGPKRAGGKSRKSSGR